MNQHPPCPWSHAVRGPCLLREHHDGQHRFADDPIPIRSERAAGALALVKSGLDAVIRDFQNARSVAAEEGTPLPETIDDDIMAALVRADALVRTQVSLRKAREASEHRPRLVPRRPASGLKPRTDARDGEST